jgi:hypothetical protein
MGIYTNWKRLQTNVTFTYILQWNVFIFYFLLYLYIDRYDAKWDVRKYYVLVCLHSDSICFPENGKECWIFFRNWNSNSRSGTETGCIWFCIMYGYYLFTEFAFQFVSFPKSLHPGLKLTFIPSLQLRLRWIQNTYNFVVVICNDNDGLIRFDDTSTRAAYLNLSYIRMNKVTESN